MRELFGRIAATTIATAVAMIACNDGTDFGGLSLGSGGKSGDGGGVAIATQSSTCTETPAPPIEKLDPESFPPCTPACAGARCVPSDKVPEVSRSSFASCGGGYCIPDALIRSGAAKPPSCKSLNGAEGVCLSVCVPQVAEHADALPQTGCASDERCAPCVNPNDNKPTGACLIGTTVPVCEKAAPGAVANPDGGEPLTCPHQGAAVLDPTQFTSCGRGVSNAHCVAASLVTPPELKSRLAECQTGGYCVPDKLIVTGGRYIPKTCTSIGGAEGRCQDQVLPEVAAQKHLPTAGCDSGERCVPCFNPVDGSDTGSCKTSCDPGPTKPAVKFADCCGGRGKCVPSSSVPAELTPNLNADSCGGGDLCAPTENIDPEFVPQSCSGFSFFLGNYSGVCVDNCVDVGDGAFALVQGSCDGNHTCAPCTDQNGQPTGAPGCP